MNKLRWERCVSTRDVLTQKFISQYLSASSRNVLLVGGAGFDPRATHIAKILSDSIGHKLRALYIREQRPDPDPTLVKSAEENYALLAAMTKNHEIKEIEIFESDYAVRGGRTAVEMLSQQDITDISDIVVDLSALSIGISFPIVRYLLEATSEHPLGCSLHVMVTASSKIDRDIHSRSSDRGAAIHGFDADFRIDEPGRARLWMPTLTSRNPVILRRIYDELQPHDVCPIVPFPADNVRRGDELLDRHVNELLNVWDIDSSSVVYAAQQNPLDIYRTVVRLFDAREKVFAEAGGSRVIMSPMGSRLQSLGALMAAFDRGISLYYVESIGYTYQSEVLHAEIDDLVVSHIWLHDSRRLN